MSEEQIIWTINPNLIFREEEGTLFSAKMMQIYHMNKTANRLLKLFFSGLTKQNWLEDARRLLGNDKLDLEEFFKKLKKHTVIVEKKS